MENEILLSIQKLLEELSSKTDSTVIASLITIGGMIGVALLTGIVQYKITRKLINSDFQKIKVQLDNEYELKRNERWQERFQNVIAELLIEIDPIINRNKYNKYQCVSAIHKVQVLLDIRIKEHSYLNQLINELGRAVNGETEKYNENAQLELHSNIVNASREIIFNTPLIPKTC